MKGETILVLEDDMVTMRGLTRRLQEAGYEVIPAATTNEALFAIRTLSPDLMVLDLTLLAEDPFNGVTDGFAFKTWMQQMFPGIDIPIIIHTADDSPTLELRAWTHGISRVVRKGGKIQELLDAIRQVLDGRQSQKSA